MNFQHRKDCRGCIDEPAAPLRMIAIDFAGAELEPIFLSKLMATKPRDLDSFRAARIRSKSAI